jgi:hypothetical protein
MMTAASMVLPLLALCGQQWTPPRLEVQPAGLAVDPTEVEGAASTPRKAAEAGRVRGRGPSVEGNKFFKGPGEGLPGGGPELMVDSIPTS